MVPGDAPFAIYYTTPVPIYLEEPYKSRISGNDPGQRFPYLGAPSSGSDISFAQFQPISYSTAYQPSNKTPYRGGLNLTIQREIGTSSVFTLGYVGTLGHHLFCPVAIQPPGVRRAACRLPSCTVMRAKAAAADLTGRMAFTRSMARRSMGRVPTRSLPDVTSVKTCSTLGTKATSRPLPTPATTRFRPPLKRSWERCVSWAPIPGRKPSITAQSSMTW